MATATGMATGKKVARGGKAARMVSADAAKSVGTLQFLPASTPEAVPVIALDPIDLAPAAMAEKPAAKKSSGTKAAQSASASTAVQTAVDAVSAALGKKKGKSGSSPRAGDPDVAYAFKVVINSVTYATFNEVAGLSWKAEAIPIRSGGNNEHGYYMRGPGKFEPLTLKRGWYASNGEFFDMIKASLAGATVLAAVGAQRVNMTISVLNRKYEPIGEYRVFNAFITEYSGPSLNAGSGQIAFEQIRMAYDYFEYKSVG